MASSPQIAQRILHAILAGKLGPGDRLGEQPLATLFECSRTVVREALTELSVRGLVASSARRGWYLVELSQDEARQVFEARDLIESAVLRRIGTVPAAAVRRLRAHVQRQEEAIRDGDVGLRSFLLGDFHVCLVDCLGNGLLTEVVRDLTARTMLAALRHQATRQAVRSCAEHAAIVQALEAADMAGAERLLTGQLRSWHEKLHLPDTPLDALGQLRQALEPVQALPPATSDAVDAPRTSRQRSSPPTQGPRP